jgi:hypothetical protein
MAIAWLALVFDQYVHAENLAGLKAEVSLVLSYGIDNVGNVKRMDIAFIRRIIVKNAGLRLFIQYSSM